MGLFPTMARGMMTFGSRFRGEAGFACGEHFARRAHWRTGERRAARQADATSAHPAGSARKLRPPDLCRARRPARGRARVRGRAHPGPGRRQARSRLPHRGHLGLRLRGDRPSRPRRGAPRPRTRGARVLRPSGRCPDPPSPRGASLARRARRRRLPRPRNRGAASGALRIGSPRSSLLRRNRLRRPRPRRRRFRRCGAQPRDRRDAHGDPRGSPRTPPPPPRLPPPPARADGLAGRLRFARTADAHASALDLDRAINRLTVIGALRDLALAYIERALQAGIDPGGAPGRWLGCAQSLLANVGGPNDLQALRRAWASLERRLPHSPEPAGARVIGELRERRDALKDALVTECPPCLESAPCRINTEMEGALGTLSQAEEDLSAALEHSILDRTRMGQLAAATHELASIEEYDGVVGAIARLALVVCPGTAALVVRARPDASLETLAASGTGIAHRGEPVAARGRGALSTPR